MWSFSTIKNKNTTIYGTKQQKVTWVLYLIKLELVNHFYPKSVIYTVYVQLKKVKTEPWGNWEEFPIYRDN